MTKSRFQSGMNFGNERTGMPYNQSNPWNTAQTTQRYIRNTHNNGGLEQEVDRRWMNGQAQVRNVQCKTNEEYLL